MMVNSHLTTRQTEALAGLEGLQAAPRHRLGCGPGQPSASGTRVGTGLAPGGAGASCQERRGGGWEVKVEVGRGHSTSQRPERRKTESEKESRNKGPAPASSVGEAPRQAEWERWGVRPTKPEGRSPRPRPGDYPPHSRDPHPGPFRASSNLRFWATAHTPLTSPPGA